MKSGSGQTMKLAENFTSKSRSVFCPLDLLVRFEYQLERLTFA